MGLFDDVIGGLFDTGGSVIGQGIQQVEKLTPEQQHLIALLTGKAAPAISGITGATIPGMEFAPGGPSQLQQQAFGMMGQMPGMFAPGPGGISQAMAPVSDYAQQQFQQRTIPSIMGALGSQGMARSSGAAGILGREGRNLGMGLAAQFAPMQLQAQMGMPGMMAGMGGLQRGIGEEQRQFGLDRFMAGAPEADPRLGFIGPAFTSAYDTAVHQGFYEPSMFSQLLSAGGAAAGGYYGAKSDKRLKENIEHIDNALEKLNQIDGKVYKFKFKETERDGGVIAQELEKILPEAVVEKDGIKYVKYSAVIALLINAVKELNQKVA